MVACDTCGFLPFGSLSSTTWGATDDISTRRCAERDRLAQVEAQISHLQVHIDVLERERAELQENLETIVYPILTIPDEISSQIFLLCLPADGRVRPSKRSAPLSLAQICSHFRRISLSTPGLWHSLVIDAWRFKSNTAMDSAVAELFRPWFTRAGLSLLRLTLHHATSLASSLLHFIVAFSPQLHVLELDTPMAEFYRLLQMLGPLPMLRKLSLWHSPHTCDLLPHIPFRNPPELTELCVFGGICLRDSSLAIIPSARLERLEITRISCHEFRRILQEYPLLRHLHVPELDGSRNVQVLPPNLRIETLGVGESSWILDILTLPNLRRLDIRITNKSPPHHLAQFLARSSCTLQHLGIVRAKDNYSRTSISEIFETLVACLQLLPTLASLSVRSPFAHPELIYGTLRNADVAPALKSLQITETGPRKIFTPVFDMLSNRARAGVLRRFELGIMDRDSSAEAWSESHIRGVQSQFDPFIKRGLDVRVSQIRYSYGTPFTSKYELLQAC
ncbi:hypothetical protein GGX14DRAFT_562433 [Mycena pura]|uniref:F-box domain-containing protein n=1 Tax=Mycena pura TaxID=153505 RepID=A0AAD6VL09_9AGAR|nr:hypothetical protein GGX14DRAFT_562433 [Mycena pura]